jgi:hypothetical protein
MKNLIFRGLMIGVFVALSFGMSLGQGLYWESLATIPKANAKEIPSTSCYRPRMFKQWSNSEAVIFRLDQGMIYYINDQKKEYAKMTFAEMEAFAKKANGGGNDQMDALKKSMDKMPAEQRKEMEKIMEKTGMGKKLDPKIVVTKTKDSKKICGYSCVKYLVMENGKEVGNVWATADIPDFKTIKKDFKEFGEKMASQMPESGQRLSAAMRDVDGFPMETSIAGMMTTVTKVEKRSIAARVFEVPPGYKKVAASTLFESGRN